MDLEAPSVPANLANRGFLDACLVEGDSADERRSRKLKRRALLVSVLLQLLFLVALLLFPLLGKSERISLRDMTPIPPYARYRGDRGRTIERQRHTTARTCNFCPPRDYNHAIVTHDPAPPNDPIDDGVDDSDLSRYGSPNGGANGILGASSDRGPVKPANGEPVKSPIVRHRISEPVLAASLVRRVEPAYPVLARQIRLEGVVELHAIISTDGRIQSLEVISGHPLLIPSALTAVREWRYRPTILNGQAVEVDTHITVVYTLSGSR